MPDISGTLDEIDYNYQQPGCVAVKAASNNNGVYLGDPILDPVFDKLNKQKAAIIIHPSRPQAVPEHVFTAGPAPLFEYIADTTRAVLNLITQGTLERYPDIKVIVPHCGSFLPNIASRLTGISKVLVPAGMMKKVDVQRNIAKLYFDIAGDAFPVALEALLKITTIDHVLYGSDYPYTPVKGIKNNLDQLISHLSEEDLKAILYNNTKKLFHL